MPTEKNSPVVGVVVPCQGQPAADKLAPFASPGPLGREVPRAAGKPEVRVRYKVLVDFAVDVLSLLDASAGDEVSVYVNGQEKVLHLANERLVRLAHRRAEHPDWTLDQLASADLDPGISVKKRGMKNPPHPGELIRAEVLYAHDLSVSRAAKALQMTSDRLATLLCDKAPLTLAVALRLEQVFGLDADRLIQMQLAYDRASTKGDLRVHTDDKLGRMVRDRAKKTKNVSSSTKKSRRRPDTTTKTET
jgi:addiction module HigA family antidote